MNAYDIVRKPVITEKSMSEMADKKYTFIVDVNANKTEIKDAVEEVFKVKVDAKTLIVVADNDVNVVKSARNIKGVKTAFVNTLNVYDILNYDKFIITKDAVKKVEEVYA